MEDIVNKKVVLKIAHQIEEHKGSNTIVLYVGEISSWTDYFIISTVRSGRHLFSLVKTLNIFLEENNIQTLNYNKRIKENGWVLLDCGNIIIHLMEKEQRDFYELENLWFRSKILYRSERQEE